MATEPIWVLVHEKLIALLSLISTANSTSYWHTIREVYEQMPATWDRAKIPAIVVQPSALPTPRVYIGGSRTVSEDLPFSVTAMLKDDQADGVGRYKRASRLMADIHRAVYSQPNLGLTRVKRVLIPAGPEIAQGPDLSGTPILQVGLVLLVELSFDDSAP